MKFSLITSLLILAMVTMYTTGCQSAESTKTAHVGECQACKTGMAGGTVWCDHCNAGFIAGKKTGCERCYLAATGGPACAKCAAKKN